VICGAGRVGIGQRSEFAGFQISQRADFVENEVGLETTFNRPIINTRDEAHANPAYFRRLHVIGGDANQFDSSLYLRLGTTGLVLKAIEAGLGMEWDALAMDDPVQETWNISHDPTLTYKAGLAGGARSALDIQKIYVDLVSETLSRAGIELSADEERVLKYWDDVLTRMSEELFSVATEVEWVGKYQLLDRQRQRLSTTWDDPKLAAMDLQWADLREERSLVAALDRAGRVKRMFAPEEVEHAADWAPEDTRAYLRGYAVRNLPGLIAASWTSLCEAQGDQMIRRPIVEAAGVDPSVLSDLEHGTLIRVEQE
ncbi:MAG: proteasome accessory factor PafA2 family protein, partial [Trueperella pyogenes]|nr:proteasome accessory factor PafA2 family protein [Trueperella pyogenes]